MLESALLKSYIGGQVGHSDTSLKILHILDHSLPLHSGYTFRTLNIFYAQQQRGWEPVGLTSLKHELACSGSQQEIETFNGLRFFRTRSTKALSDSLRAPLQIMSSLACRIREVVVFEKPHLLHVHSPVLNLLPALWIGKKFDVPVIYEIRAFWEDAAVDHGTYGMNSWKYHMVKSLETWACQKAKAVIVICHGLKDDLTKRGISSDKLTIIPNGINVQDFQDCQPDEELKRLWNINGKKVIGFIGSFYRYEGLDFLVQAFRNLVPHHPNLILLLVGGGEMKKKLEGQVKAYGLESQVVFSGRISHDRIPGVYGLVDIFVYPRTSIRLTELVTPLKPLEAMLMGKPLVASDIGGHRELITDGETGLLFPPGDVEALTHILSRVLGDRALGEHLATQGREWVRKERSWEKTTAGYIDVYEKALVGSGKRW